MADLKTDYKDDVLDVSVNEKRRWIITENGDGTVTIEDATSYSQIGDIFGSADLNAITLAIKECFQSVSNGKALIASAITDKKVPTDATETFAEMANKIVGLKLGSGNAVPSDVRKGKTFTNADGVEYVGTLIVYTQTQTGSIVVCTDLAGQASVSADISFDEPFTEVPSVTGKAISSVGNVSSSLSVSFSNITTYGCRVTVKNNQASNGYNAKTVTVEWTAKGTNTK